MTPTSMGFGLRPGAESRAGRRRARLGRLLRRSTALALALLGAIPAVASAHGPINPVASDYVATITHVPVPLQAKVVDGDLRLWLQSPARLTVVVLDYNGAPYLRFDSRGVQANTNSSMYYLNQTPAEVPPTNLTRASPIRWQGVTGSHQYEWHDGRLHALAAVAVTPSTRYVGRWEIPLLIDGRLTSMSGSVFHRHAPSILWFWPIAVLIGCVLAGWRLRDPELDRKLADLLGASALLSLAVLSIGRDLHGRPGVTVFQLIELSVVLTFAAVVLVRVVRGRASYLLLLMVAVVALYEGILTLPTLTHGYVLLALTPFLARCACVICLGTVPCLLLMVTRLFDAEQEREPRQAGASASANEAELPQVARSG